MKVFIHKSKDNECSNPNSFIALDGFRQMGWEITAFQNAQLLQELQPHNVVVGGITEVTHALAHFNIPLPAPLDYPIELRSWLGREIWESTMYAIAGNIPKNGVFC